MMFIEKVSSDSYTEVLHDEFWSDEKIKQSVYKDIFNI